MRKTMIAGVVMIVIFSLAGIGLATPVTKQLPYTKPVSLSLATPYTLRFSLWTAATGGTQVWFEDQPITFTAAPPVINTFLGKVTPLSGVDFSQQLWVQVEQSGAAALGTRDILTAAPYAFWSDTVRTPLNLPADGLTVGTNQLVVSGGNVGIGTVAAPAQKLEVNGAVKATVFLGDGTSLSGLVSKGGGTMTGMLNLPANGLAVGTDQLVVSGGNVGIGTAPGAKLHVNGNLTINGPFTFPNSSGGYATLTNRTFDNEASFQSNNIKLSLGSVGPAQLLNAPPLAYEFAIGHSRQSLIRSLTGIKLKYGSSFEKAFSVNQDGKLKVSGSVSGGQTTTGWVLGKGGWGPDNWLRLTTTEGGSTYHDLAVNQLWAAGAKRFDLAEVTPVKNGDKLEQGDVVVIDPEQGLRVARSTKPNDTAVYGIVSSYEQASFVIGGEGPETATGATDRLPVALIGRVKAKVSAEAGPIRPGDRLTTSTTPGHLMRCGDPSKCAGAIAGKALEPFDSGRGVITVLVTLQ